MTHPTFQQALDALADGVGQRQQVAAVKRWENDPRVEIHGPGYSKVIFGEDEADHFEKYIDVVASSIASNSGRSCVNASGVWLVDLDPLAASATGAGCVAAAWWRPSCRTSGSSASSRARG